MTYEQAKKWLAAIGGEEIIERETEDRGSVIVLVKPSKGGEVSRHWLFDEKLTDTAREDAIRTAFLAACRELKLALD
jgi:hypothetical protein